VFTNRGTIAALSCAAAVSVAVLSVGKATYASTSAAAATDPSFGSRTSRTELRATHGSRPPGLYVSSPVTFTGFVNLLSSRSYVLLDSISQGLISADGEWLDGAGNLYIADPGGVAVQEYASGSSVPTATYSSGLVYPVSVTTDATGNVYVVDSNCKGIGSCAYGSVAEFAQGSNVRTRTYKIAGTPEDARFDSKGNLLVDWVDPLTLRSGGIERFARGSSKGKSTGISLSDSFPVGMAIDRNQNLLICNQIGPNQGVYVIPPPYKQTKAELTWINSATPHRVAFSGDQRKLFVSDPGGAGGYGSVVVLDYPAGTPQTFLSGSNILRPYGVADAPVVVPR
jgi:hypothetical protein